MSATLAPEQRTEPTTVRKRKKRTPLRGRPPQNKGGWILLAAFALIIVVAILAAYTIISPEAAGPYVPVQKQHG